MGKRAKVTSVVAIGAVSILLVSVADATVSRVFDASVDWIGSKFESDLEVQEWPQGTYTPKAGKKHFKGGDLPLGAPSFVIPKKLNQISGLPPTGANGDVYEKWFISRGGIRADNMVVQFSITANVKPPVQITAVSARVISKTKPLSGVYFPPLGGGDLFDRILFVDFDQDPPKQHISSSQDGMSEAGDWSFPISVGSDDTIILTVVAGVRKAAVDWVIDIEYVYKGKRRTQVIDDDGEPFRLTGSAGAGETLRMQPDGSFSSE